MSIVVRVHGPTKCAAALAEQPVHRNWVDSSRRRSGANVPAMLGKQIDQVASLEGREPPTERRR
ncbi:MAG: hypothetical protein IPL61_28815 [Myxococcales bacterium]|nr:hypothetical protein [Myxococcales bacterium]